MKITTSTRPDHDTLVKIIGDAMNEAHHKGQRMGEAASMTLLHEYPELWNAMQSLGGADRADPFHVQNTDAGNFRWDNFWYVIRRAYGL